MPRVRRKSKTKPTYTNSHVFQLVHGHDFFNNAFGRDMDAMHEAWPILRDRVWDLFEQRKAGGRHEDKASPWGEALFGDGNMNEWTREPPCFK